MRRRQRLTITAAEKRASPRECDCSKSRRLRFIAGWKATTLACELWQRPDNGDAGLRQCWSSISAAASSDFSILKFA